MNPIIQTVLDAHFPGVAKPVVMEESDEIKALAHELCIRTAERDALAAMAAGMRQSPDMRSIVGELRRVLAEMGRLSDSGVSMPVKPVAMIADLVRRMEEPNQGIQ